MSEQPMEDAANQAAQSAAMSVRALIMMAGAISEYSGRNSVATDRVEAVDVLRQLEGSTLPDPQEQYAQMVREEYANPAVRDALLNSEQWPQMAAELRQLETAGVDVRDFIAESGRVADRVAQRIAPQPSSPAQVLRENLPIELADAVVNSRQWPQVEQQFRQMQDAGVDVSQVMRDASTSLAQVETSTASAIQQQAARAERLDKEANPRRGTTRNGGSELAGRAAALEAAGVSPQQNEACVRRVGESLNTHDAGLLVVSDRWPQIAANMTRLQERNIDAGARLAAQWQRSGNGDIPVDQAAEMGLKRRAPSEGRAGAAEQRTATAEAARSLSRTAGAPPSTSAVSSTSRPTNPVPSHQHTPGRTR